jgi:hypothetical protein
MAAVRSGKCLLALAALAFALAMLPRAGFAYTPEEQQACQPDAFRLCSSEIPDVDRITACMIAKRSQLSPDCRRFFHGPAERSERAAAPLNIRPAATKSRRARKPVKHDAAT